MSLLATALSGRPALGTVYGTLLNYRDALDAMGVALSQPPYNAPPKAPILYLKPRNTIIAEGDDIVVPEGVNEVEIGAALGLVIGRTACRVSERDALSFVSGYAIVVDVSIPHASYYRPSLRFKCRDTFCPVGAWVAREFVSDPNSLEIVVTIDGQPVQRANTNGLVRSVERLLCDVTDFMTLTPGDVLLVGVPHGAPRARAGQRVAVEIEHLGRLENRLVAEGGNAPGAEGSGRP